MSRMSQVMQMGEIGEDLHIYIEDYAYTYLKKQKDNVIVFSCLRDKNFDEMINMLIDAGHKVYLTNFESDRNLDLSVIEPRPNLYIIERYEDALERA